MRNRMAVRSWKWALAVCLIRCDAFCSCRCFILATCAAGSPDDFLFLSCLWELMDRVCLVLYPGICMCICGSGSFLCCELVDGCCTRCRSSRSRLVWFGLGLGHHSVACWSALSRFHTLCPSVHHSMRCCRALPVLSCFHWRLGLPSSIA